MTTSPHQLYQEAQRHTAPSMELAKAWSWAIAQNDPMYAVSVDTETTSATWGVPQAYGDIVGDYPIVFGISACVPGPDGLHLLWGRRGTSMFDWMRKRLSHEYPKVAHNARFDKRACEDQGIIIGPTLGDTLTMARIVWDRRRKFDLQTLCEMLVPEVSDWCTPVQKSLLKLGHAFKKSGAPRKPNYSDVPDSIMGPYSMTDSFVCYMLNLRLWPIIHKDYAELYAREMAVIDRVVDIERVGIPFNAKQARIEANELTRKIRLRKAVIIAKSGVRGFNPNAPAKVMAAVRKMGVSKALLVYKGVASTNAKVLEKLVDSKIDKLSPQAAAFIHSLLTYRALTKIRGTYLRPLARRAELAGGRVYCSINPTNSRTGRMSSSDPNLQNIPRAKEPDQPGYAVKRCVEVPEGYEFWYFDVEAFEFAVFGLIAGERTILDAYAAGEDLHLAMAKRVFGEERAADMRQATKTLDFAIIYGSGDKQVATQLKYTVEQAAELRAMYYAMFPAIPRFIKYCNMQLRRHGYVEDYFGKRYHIEHGMGYKGVNALVQGGCAQAFKIGLLNVPIRYVKSPKCKLFLPVHDEAQFMRRITDNSLTEQFVGDIVGAMQDVPQFTSRGLTLRIDVKRATTSWAEKQAWPERKVA
jgi:DNA polymerase-1